MANVALLASAVSAPTGLWPTIMNWIESSVVNYGWVIILFTLLIKACLSPLDLLLKFSTKKTTLVQQKLAPQIARINKRCGDDKQQAQMQTQALYKKEGFNVFGSCIVTLVNLVVTMVVFFTLFASLRQMSAYKAINQYAQMEQAYVSTLQVKTKENFINLINTNLDGTGKTYDSEYKTAFEGDGTEENKGYFYYLFSSEGLSEEVVNTLKTTVVYTSSEGVDVSLYSVLETAENSAAVDATNSASEVWKKVKDSWLWIGNIWVSDNYKSPLPSYSDLKSMANSSKNKEYKAYVNSIDQKLYGVVTSSVHAQNSRWNGYYILAVLSAGLTFLSQWLTELLQKSKNKKVNDLVQQSNQQAGAMKFMKIFLPVMMVIFVLTSSASFGLYIVASSLISMLISTLTSLIVNACYKKKEEEIVATLEREAIRSMKKGKNGNVQTMNKHKR